MDKIMVHTNNIPRDIIYFWEFTPSEQEHITREYDWLDDPNEAEFFRYKKDIYCLSDFTNVHNPYWGASKQFSDWDGYMSLGFIGGLVIKYPRMDYNPQELDTDHIIVGWY